MSRTCLTFGILYVTMGGMTNLAGLDQYLENFETPAAPIPADEQDDDAIITRAIGTCFHCGDEGCKNCEGDLEPDYDDEYEVSAAEARYESYLDRS